MAFHTRSSNPFAKPSHGAGPEILQLQGWKPVSTSHLDLDIFYVPLGQNVRLSVQQPGVFLRLGCCARLGKMVHSGGRTCKLIIQRSRLAGEAPTGGRKET
eukprot:s252_g5.t1